MDMEELTQYSHFTTGFSEAYGKRLSSLLLTPELHDCFSCIEFMLKNKVRLEQETMLM
jgi:hypothetical protein